MSKHSRKRKPQQPHRADWQRAELDRYLTTVVYAEIRSAFASAQQSIAPVLAEFTRDLTAEWDRVTKELAKSLDNDANSREVITQRAAQLRHWLIVSGWRTRLLHAYQQAAHAAGQQALATIQQAQKPALEIGWNHARLLLIEAMQPAIRAGMPWRPKP